MWRLVRRVHVGVVGVRCGAAPDRAATRGSTRLQNRFLAAQLSSRPDFCNKIGQLQTGQSRPDTPDSGENADARISQTALPTPQRNRDGPGTMPVTFLRHARCLKDQPSFTGTSGS
jgi:hypothetical protein